MSSRRLSDHEPSTRGPAARRRSKQRPGEPADERTDVDVFLELLVDFPDSVVVGFRPDGAHIDVHVAPLPPDERTGAAGLFGMEAPGDWSAVGVAIAGRARHMQTRQILSRSANAAVVVTRAGACASWMRAEGLPEGERTDGGAEGLVVDGLHRMLGLPVPGDPPSPTRLALTIWAHQILELLLAHGTVSWQDALEVHPGEPGRGPVAPSVEMLVEATVRATEGFRWSNMHARAAAGAITVHELSTAEAAWMDTTMFARWVAGSMPDPSVAIGLLEQHQCPAVADGLRDLLAGVEDLDRIAACGSGERRVTPE